MNGDLQIVLIIVQCLYSGVFITLAYFICRPINWVHIEKAHAVPPENYPYIVLFYPVLRELEETMRTTMLGLAKLDYPRNKFRVVALPNENDTGTIHSLQQLTGNFPFLEIMQIPPTSHPKWNIVWDAWNQNTEAVWWHKGKYKHVQELPPKKTRQMIFAFYNLVEELKHDPTIGNWLLNYIDADSVPQPNHFLSAVAGMQEYDVLQSTNIAGNLLQTYAATWCAMDHLNWDYNLYPHMSANGRHPFWVLGKGLFYKSGDLIDIGGFDPWVAIEDPDIGLRLYAKGKKIGIIPEPLIEEVPITLSGCITQRKRWFCGFLQSTLGENKLKGLSIIHKVKAYINLIPVISLAINSLGLPIGIWTLSMTFFNTIDLPLTLIILSAINVYCYFSTLLYFYASAWDKIGLVLPDKWDKIRFLLRVNPLFLWVYWTIWVIPMVIGFKMFLSEGGLIWQRTKKIDANHDLVRQNLVPESH